MAVVEANSIVNLLENSGMLSNTYSKEQLKNDLNTSFYKIEYENVSEIIKYIATTTSAPIKNRHDLNVFTLDVKQAKLRSDVYKKYDETLSLKSVDDFKYDPELVVAKIEYCKKYNYPYCDENGVLFDEVVTEFESGSYLRKFYDLYKEKYNNNYMIEYKDILEDETEDKTSEFYGLIQTNSFKFFHKLCFISSNFEETISPILNNENIDINNKLYSAFCNLKANNPFIDTDLISFTFNHDSYDRRNGQR